MSLETGTYRAQLVESPPRRSFRKRLDISHVIDIPEGQLVSKTDLKPRALLPFPSAEQAEMLLSTTQTLLHEHEVHIGSFLAEGADYFRFPKIPSPLAEAHRRITEEEAEGIARLWIEGNLHDAVEEQYTPRAIGSFLLAITQQNGKTFQEVLTSLKFQKDDPAIQKKLQRAFELDTTAFLYKHPHRGEVFGMIPGDDTDVEERYNLTHNAAKLGAISLFGYGIHTANFTEIFNHVDEHIIINEFGENQIPALSEAAKDALIVDNMLGEDTVGYLVNLALTGAKVRAGEQHELPLLAPKGAFLLEELARAHLQYLFASHSDEEITDSELRVALQTPLNENQVERVLGLLITTGKAISDNSLLLENLPTTMTADPAMSALGTALEVTEGDLSQLQPQMQNLLRQTYDGDIMADTMASFLYTCIGMDLAVPDVAKVCLGDPRNRDAIQALFSPRYISEYRKSGPFNSRTKMPKDPFYTIISEGLINLPSGVQKVFDTIATQEERNIVAKDIFDKLFGDRYFRSYFGYEGTRSLTPDQKKSYADVRRKLWTIVHPDIWKLLGQADDTLLAKWIHDSMPFGKVYLEIEINGKDQTGKPITHTKGINVPLTRALPAEIADKLKTPPKGRLPLRDRLRWTSRGLGGREEEAEDRRVTSTDYVRNNLLPRANRHYIDLLTQIRLIHRAHMKGNEHVLLDAGQAHRVLRSGEMKNVDRLDGRIRSKDGMAVNIGLAGMKVLCASYENTPKLMENLTHVIEEFFPIGEKHPAVNEDTIHYFASALQYYIALIHPYYEANGRSSEDAMYILWERRPDLMHTRRYISTDGRRQGEYVQQRMNIIDEGGVGIVRDIGKIFKLTDEERAKITCYADLVGAVQSKSRRGTQTINKISVDGNYHSSYDVRLNQEIGQIRNLDLLMNHPVIRELAEHLKNAPESYIDKATLQGNSDATSWASDGFSKNS